MTFVDTVFKRVKPISITEGVKLVNKLNMTVPELWLYVSLPKFEPAMEN